VQPQVLGLDVPVLIRVQNSTPFYLETAFYSLIISLLAIGIAVYNIAAGKTKDTKARRQSINDEFWLRKVLFPTSIEPILVFFANTIRTLPKDRSDPLATAKEVEEFLEKFKEDHAEQASKLLSVGILKPSLYTDLSAEFEEVEDVVTDFCFANKDGFDQANPVATISRGSATTKLSEMQIQMLQNIKNLQESLS